MSFIDELYLIAKGFNLLYFGDVIRNSPLYSRRGKLIFWVDEPHSHKSDMNNEKNFIYKAGNVCIQTQWKVKIENIHLFMEFKEGWMTHVQKTLNSYESITNFI